jgi:hypothetical protein
MQAQTQPFEPFHAFYSAITAALRPFDQPNTRFSGEFTRQQLEFIKLCAELGNREWKLWTSAKNPLEMFAAQAGIAMEFSMKFTDRSCEAIASMREAMASFGWSKPDLTPMPATEETEPKAELEVPREETSKTIRAKKAAS